MGRTNILGKLTNELKKKSKRVSENAVKEITAFEEKKILDISSFLDDTVRQLDSRFDIGDIKASIDRCQKDIASIKAEFAVYRTKIDRVLRAQAEIDNLHAKITHTLENEIKEYTKKIQTHKEQCTSVIRRVSKCMKEKLHDID